MPQTIRRAPRSRGFPIFLGVFLALVVILIWEAASSQAGYDRWTHTDPATGEVNKLGIRDGRWQLAVELEGDVEVNAGETAIERLGPGARLEIEERRRRRRWRFVATPGAGGEPEIAWFVDRKRTDFDAAGEKWLAAVLPRIYRSTGLDTEGRVERILARGGVEGVLGEIGKIDSDRIQRLYFDQLTVQADLTPQELGRVLHRLGREIGSDHEMGQALALIPTAHLADERVARAFAEAAGTIGSDATLAQMLGAHLRAPALTAEAGETLLAAARSVDGDYELASLLVELAATWEGELPPAYFRAADTIGSDFERARVLKATVERPGVDSATLAAVLESALGIGTDYERAQLLLAVVATHPLDAELRPAFERAVATIGSDYERQRVEAAADPE